MNVTSRCQSAFFFLEEGIFYIFFYKNIIMRIGRSVCRERVFHYIPQDRPRSSYRFLPHTPSRASLMTRKLVSEKHTWVCVQKPSEHLTRKG